MIAALVEKLDRSLQGGQLELPSLPEVALKIRRALADDNVSVNEVARLSHGPGARRADSAHSEQRDVLSRPQADHELERRRFAARLSRGCCTRSASSTS